MQWSGLGDTTNTAPAPDLERRLSKREKKELKKREKEARKQEAASNKENIAKRLYDAAPDSSFTRSISNPEMVMRRRRQLKLERKLQQIRASDDGPNSGTLPDFTLPYLTFWAGRLLHPPSTEAVSVRSDG